MSIWEIPCAKPSWATSTEQDCSHVALWAPSRPSRAHKNVGGCPWALLEREERRAGRRHGDLHLGAGGDPWPGIAAARRANNQSCGRPRAPELPPHRARSRAAFAPVRAPPRPATTASPRALGQMEPPVPDAARYRWELFWMRKSQGQCGHFYYPFLLWNSFNSFIPCPFDGHPKQGQTDSSF